MLVNDVMTADVECARPNDTIAAAAARMRDLDVGALPVCGANERLVGMITDRDITIRATARCCDPAHTKVSEVMTHDISYCYEDEEVSQAAWQMMEERVRRLPVLSRDKQLVGVVSLGDLAVDGDQQLAGQALEAISEQPH